MTIKERINLIKKELSAISISGSFYTCSAADRVFDKLTRMAVDAKIRIKKGEIVEGFAIALKVFLKSKALCSKADTSSGAWMYTEGEAIDAMDVAVSVATDASERVYMFSELLKAASKKEAFDWDGDFDLLRIATKLVTNKNSTLWLNKLSDVTIAHNKESYSSWKNFSEIILMAEYLLCFEPSAYKSYLDHHLDIADVRLSRVGLAITDSEFELAEKLCLEKHQKEQPNSGSQWAELLVEIYKKSNQTDKLLVLFEDLLFKSMLSKKYDAYEEMREIYQKQRIWDEKYSQLLNRAHSENWRLYISILEAEQDWLRYIDALQSSPQDIYKSGKKFVKDYPKQVYDLFRLAILHDAEVASNRKHYYYIAKRLKDLEKLDGIVEAAAIRAELIQTYANRPALLEELEIARQGRTSNAWRR